MTLTDRLDAFSTLSQKLHEVVKNRREFEEIAEKSYIENNWFQDNQVEHALMALSKMLESDKLLEWISKYNENSSQKTIGIVAAGNIPLVGFHDILCVLISGHKCQIKTSSKDDYLIRKIAQWLVEIESEFGSLITIQDKLEGFDAIIATGSDNSSRYFEYYFSKYPNIIRKNRTSVAVLSGDETSEEIRALGSDVFDYFGLGCRNVSKIFVPEKFDVRTLFDNWKDYEFLIDNHKYRNNYEYQKSILLVNKVKHLDSGFSLLKESEDLVSPIALNYYNRYKDADDVRKIIERDREKIQCIVGNVDGIDGIPFGSTQEPELWDFADNVDTMAFLERL